MSIVNSAVSKLEAAERKSFKERIARLEEKVKSGLTPDSARSMPETTEEADAKQASEAVEASESPSTYSDEAFASELAEIRKSAKSVEQVKKTAPVR